MTMLDGVLEYFGLCKKSELEWVQQDYDSYIVEMHNQLDKKEKAIDAIRSEYTQFSNITDKTIESLSETNKDLKLQKEKYRDLYLQAMDSNCEIAKRVNDKFQDAIRDIKREFDNTIALKLNRSGSKRIYLRSRPIALLKKINSYMENLSEITASVISEVQNDMMVEGIEKKEYTIDRFLNGDFVINCTTKEDAIKLMEMLEKINLCWSSGMDINTDETYWSEVGSEILYGIVEGDLMYGTFGFGKRKKVDFKEVHNG